MVKLKESKVRKIICPTCRGNGFVSIKHFNDSETYTHQCWDCDSEGEFYETVENDNDIDDGPTNKLH